MIIFTNYHCDKAYDKFYSSGSHTSSAFMLKISNKREKLLILFSYFKKRRRKRMTITRVILKKDESSGCVDIFLLPNDKNHSRIESFYNKNKTGKEENFQNYLSITLFFLYT